MKYICLDIGTTNVKGAIYDECSKLIYESSRNIKLLTPNTIMREHDPNEILGHIRSILIELVSHIHERKEKVGFISISCYMHSLMLIDKEFKPLTNVILWNDARASDIANLYRNTDIGMNIYYNTGTPIHPMSPLYKILYYKKHDIRKFNDAKMFVGIKEYITYYMCGDWYIDYSLASSTGLFDIHNYKWNKNALELLEIDDTCLSKPVNTTFILPNIKKEFLDDIGITYDINIVIGASDGCLANLGSHGIELGTAVCTIGTSGAYRIVTDKPVLDREGRIFSYILNKDIYVSGGAINNGCIAYDFILNKLNYSTHIDDIFEGIDYTKYGRGIVFLPFLSGERAPYWDSELRSSILGLNQTHTRKDILYAAIKGISFAIKDVYEIINKAIGYNINKIYVNGGFTKSDIWVQTLSNILNKQIIISDNGNGPLLGAFILGMLAMNKIENIEKAEKFFTISKIFNSLDESFYNEEFNIYKKAIKLNTELFHELAKLAY